MTPTDHELYDIGLLRLTQIDRSNVDSICKNFDRCKPIYYPLINGVCKTKVRHSCPEYNKGITPIKVCTMRNSCPRYEAYTCSSSSYINQCRELDDFFFEGEDKR